MVTSDSSGGPMSPRGWILGAPQHQGSVDARVEAAPPHPCPLYPTSRSAGTPHPASPHCCLPAPRVPPAPTPRWPEPALTYTGSTGGWPCRSSGRASPARPSGPNSGSLWKVLHTPPGRPTPSARRSMWRSGENTAGAAPGAPSAARTQSAASLVQMPAHVLMGHQHQDSSALHTDKEAVILHRANSDLKIAVRAHKANPVRPQDPRSLLSLPPGEPSRPAPRHGADVQHSRTPDSPKKTPEPITDQQWTERGLSTQYRGEQRPPRQVSFHSEPVNGTISGTQIYQPACTCAEGN